MGSEIDPRVKPLVDRMNGTGAIKTVASCQGHPVGGNAPYVYFRTEVPVAAAIERRLREIALRRDPVLHFMWLVEGNFNENYDLVFRLYAPRLLDQAHSLLNLTPVWFLTRKWLDADLLSLAGIIEDAVLSDIGDIDKPEITEATNDHG